MHICFPRTDIRIIYLFEFNLKLQTTTVEYIKPTQNFSVSCPETGQVLEHKFYKELLKELGFLSLGKRMLLTLELPEKIL